MATQNDEALHLVTGHFPGLLLDDRQRENLPGTFTGEGVEADGGAAWSVLNCG